jgi:phosphoribosylaminoimidazole-succinocarboxamide synthase
MNPLCTLDSRHLTMRGLVNGDEVSTKDSERLWGTTRIANTICAFRRDYGMKIKTVERKTVNGKKHGVYYLDGSKENIEKAKKLLRLFADEVKSRQANSLVR